MGSSTRFVGSFIMCSIHLIWEKIPFVKVFERGKVVEAKFKDRNVWWSLSSTSARFQIRRSPGECTSIQIYRRRRAHTRSPVHSSRVSVALSNWRRRSFHALRKYRGRKNEVFARFRSPLTFPRSSITSF